MTPESGHSLGHDLNLSRTRCSVLHAAPQSRDPHKACGLDGPRLGSAALRAALRPGHAASYPRPTNGIFEAITVMNSTLASSGRLAM
ncbi:hypothetical protein SAMN05443248_5497 [Bradyrhizobium erythrophlei]|uniref:Uncharacterized protein n=1 Tax=Bradyrhizobium erythrophlei TaxID=1437360 RepID=A0A1M5ULL0_9BRAD|nr:hypothetical protein SAMN05443248_5497 [Bradyrhizobium erythrophlei]